MKMMKKSLLVLAILATTTLNAQAGNSAELKVTGTILPSACEPTFGSGGTIDYSDIKSHELSENDYTILTTKSIDFSISCTAPTKVGFKLTNGRVGSLVGDTEGSAGFGFTPAGVNLFGYATSISAAGLGMNGTEKIGGFSVKLDQGDATADGNPVDNLSSASAGVWGKSNTLLMFSDLEPTFTAASPGTLVPLAFEQYDAKIQLQSYLNKASELTLTKEIKLDGLITFDLEYLP